MTVRSRTRLQSTRQPLSLAYLWSLARTPEALILSLLGLGLALLLVSLIPQTPLIITRLPLDATERTGWLAELPQVYQNLAPILTSLGLFQVVYSAWLWLPLASLLFIGLINLADYLPYIQSYWQKDSLKLTKPFAHPFNEHTQQSLAVPAPAESNKSAASVVTLSMVQDKLEGAGYQVEKSADQTLVAVRHSRRKFGPVLIIAGLVLIIAGLFVQTIWGSHYAFETIRNKQTPVAFGEQSIRIGRFAPAFDRGERLIGGDLGVSVNGAPEVAWRLHRPYRINGWWVVVGGLRPQARITLEPEDSPLENFVLSFPGANQPAYFIYPAADLRFALSYQATANEPTYRLQIDQNGLSARPAPKINQLGPTFGIPDIGLNGRIAMQEIAPISAFKLPGLLPITLGLVTLAAGLVITTLPSPVTVWLTLVTRGRGSRIDILTEQFRTWAATPTLVLPALNEEINE